MSDAYDRYLPSGMDTERSAKNGLGGPLLRFFALQALASVALGVCVAYALGPAGPTPYSERINFTLRLGDEVRALPEPLNDGFHLRLDSGRSTD